MKQPVRFSRSRFAAIVGTAIAPAVPHLALADDVYTLRLSTATSDQYSYNVAIGRYAANVLRRTNGRVKVDVYPNGQLATTLAGTQGLISGSIDLTLNAIDQVISLVPRMQALLLPFVFKDMRGYYRLIDGRIGDDLFGELETKGIVVLSRGAGAPREFETTGAAIRTPADIKGLRFRVHGGTEVPMMQTLGAIPTPIDFSELHVAMSQRAVDGFENSLEGPYFEKMYSVIRHISMSNHIMSTSPLLASRRKFESLPADLQKVLRDEGNAMNSYYRKIVADKAIEAENGLRANGVVFTNIDYAAFRAAMDPVYTSYESKLGREFVQRVTKAGA